MRRLFLLVLILSSFSLSAEEKNLSIYKIEDEIPEPIENPNSKFIFKVSPYYTHINAGTTIEVMRVGSSCSFQEKFIVNGDRTVPANGVVANELKQEFKKFNIKTTDLNVDLILTPYVLDARINSCYKDKSFSSAKGQAYVQVNWVLKSQRTNAEIFTIMTSGSHENINFIDNSSKEFNLLTMAMLMSVRKLINNDDFRLLARGTDQSEEIQLEYY